METLSPNEVMMSSRYCGFCWSSISNNKSISTLSFIIIILPVVIFGEQNRAIFIQTGQ